jgi:2-hydroxy-6-oxonona-2,4-dienedioate hydrolase
MSASPAAAEPRAYLNQALRHDDVARLIASAKQHRTPHAGGVVMWHEWGEGPPLLLLHGGFGSWLHWVRNIEALAKHFRVLAADMPGLGESDAVAMEGQPSAADVAKPLLAGLDQLIGADTPVRMVAFSLGAVIGSQVALGLGKRLMMAVLIGPSGLGDLWRNYTTELVRRHPGMSEAERRANVRHNLRHSMIANDAAIDDMALDIQIDLTKQKRKLLGLPISLSSALVDAIPQLVPRLAIIWGERDCYIEPDVRSGAAELNRRVPDLQVRIIPDIGHWAAYEAAPVVNRMLLEFLLLKQDAKAKKDVKD